MAVFDSSTVIPGIIGLSLLTCLIIGAIYSFALIQTWLADPDRKQFNEEWFRRFEKNLSERYDDPALKWRYNALNNMWAAKDDS